MQRSKPCVDIQLHTFSVAKYVILRQIPSLRQIRTNYHTRIFYILPFACKSQFIGQNGLNMSFYSGKWGFYYWIYHFHIYL